MTREEWLRAGADLMIHEGPDALRIDRIAASIGMTKGSFYHHFRDRAAFIAALLLQWEEEATDRLIRETEKAKVPTDKIKLMRFMIAEINHPLEIAFRAWGRHDAEVGGHVQKVDRVRMRFFVDLCRAFLGGGEEEARFMAELGYASFVGAQHLGILKRTKSEIETWTRRYLELFGGPVE